MMNRTMTRSNGRWRVLIALWLLFAIHALAQHSAPTLQNNLNSIAKALNSRGTISWTEELPEIFGARYTITNILTEVNADSSACSLSWTSVYTSSDDKLAVTYLVKLESISNVLVRTGKEDRQFESVQKVEVSPDRYVVVVKADSPLSTHREFYRKGKLKKEINPPSDREVRVVFSDERTANSIADSIRQAAKSCRDAKSSF